MNEANVRKYLDVIKRAIALIEENLGGEQVLNLGELPPDYTQVRQKHVQDLMAIDCWPQAIPDYLVREPSDASQVNRANSILDYLVDENFEDKHFLDYGCGGGWVAQEVVFRGVASSTGFDVEKNPHWGTRKAKFTAAPDDLINGHYDIIFMYDVLDHCQDPKQVMNHVKSLLAPRGVVYLRNHPWSSRHATHLVEKGLNKAFIHLFLTDEELVNLGYEQLFVQRLTDPLGSYHEWFSDFKIDKERTMTSGLSDFFLVPSFKQLIIDEQGLKGNRKEEFFQDMMLEFVDYKIHI